MPFALFSGSSILSEKVFCVIWFGSTSWFLFINLTKARFRNFFRIRGEAETAKFFQIEKRREVVFLLDDHSPLLDSVRVVETIVRRLFNFGRLEKIRSILIYLTKDTEEPWL